LQKEPPRDEYDQVAAITNNDPYLRLEKIDGKAVGLGRFQGTTRLAVGPHEITVRYYREIPDKFLSRKTLEAQGQIHLETTAGAKYILKCAIIGYKAVFWIEDAQSGQVVAGVRPKRSRGPDPTSTAATE
jgi:hypothetical protein